MEILKVDRLSFAYAEADKEALCDVSFALESGSFTVLTGDSGSGKSTLLRLLKREIAPRGTASGDIAVCGVAQNMLSDRESASRIGFVSQYPDEQIVTDRVWHELAFGLESLGKDDAFMRRRVAEIASFFGIGDWFRMQTDALSGGQKQLLCLASVLAAEPDILLLDEPTSRLDPVSEAEFLSLLERLNRELGITVLLSAHDTERVFGMADRVLHLQDGRLIFDGTPRAFATAVAIEKVGCLPSASQIYRKASFSGACPLTVSEGRRMLDGKTLTCPETPPKPFGDTVLKAKDLCFRFTREGKVLADHITFELHAGEHLCLLGGNGSGKTTLLRLLCGALKPVSGKVRAVGEIAYLPQEPQTLFGEPSVREDFLLYCKKVNKTPELIGRVAERIGIAHLLDRHPYDLSGGELQLCAVAKLLLQDPRVLLLDEPTKGLDAAARGRLTNVLQELTASGVAVLTVTHDVRFAASSAYTCALLFDGNLHTPEPTRDFFAQNRFYTTPTSRMTDGICILPEDVIYHIN
ncbi:MAG: ATP-binding cassette domain-containing protein [Clostridia bacterium]|nr:ATP-binding cassette domain-containing protein [Clostridia bacterium]